MALNATRVFYQISRHETFIYLIFISHLIVRLMSFIIQSLSNDFFTTGSETYLIVCWSCFLQDWHFLHPSVANSERKNPDTCTQISQSLKLMRIKLKRSRYCKINGASCLQVVCFLWTAKYKYLGTITS